MTGKPQLHVSMIEMLFRCGEQFKRRYGHLFGLWPKEEIIPPSIALATGISVHKTIDANLNHKMESDNGDLLPRDQIRDMARDEFENVWTGGMMLTDEEAVDVKAVHGKAVDQTIALSVLHHEELAPAIKPVAVEEKFVVILPKYPYDLAGTIDIREATGLRDTKTSKRAPSGDAARTLQGAMYCMAHEVNRMGCEPEDEVGKLPDWWTIDFLVKSNESAVTHYFKPDRPWIDLVQARIVRATEFIEAVKEGKAAFLPADADAMNWRCSKKFCGYATTCEFWSGR